MTQALEQLEQVLISFDTSLVPERLRESAFRPVLESSVDPLLSACALASHALAAEDAAVFLTNVAVATVDVMKRKHSVNLCLRFNCLVDMGDSHGGCSLRFSLSLSGSVLFHVLEMLTAQ